MLKRIAIFAVIVAVLLLAACGGSCARQAKNTALSSTFSPAQANGAYQFALNHLPSDIRSELDSLALPKSCDSALFQKLKESFAQALAQKLAGGGKLVSAPPSGDINRVNDLSITANGDGTYTLHWSYYSRGDYDQNGSVGVTDITPIAMHFGEDVPLGNPDSIQIIIHGGNGNVGIADITTIAMNYGVECAVYEVQGAPATGAFSKVHNVLISAASGKETGRAKFSYSFDLGGNRRFRVVPVDGSGALGVESNEVNVNPTPPTIVSVQPLTGTENQPLTLVTTVNGSQPFTYDWQFGTSGSPISSNLNSPTVTYAEPSDYDCSLTVTNAYGSDTFNFTLTIEQKITGDLTYPVVDTGQDFCYDNSAVITPPSSGQAFFGQDAQYNGFQPSLTLSGDGKTVSDNITGLTWTQSPDADGDGQIQADDKFTWNEMQSYPATLNAENYGGYSDWRLPTIKELYSLIDFRGTDPSGMTGNDTSGLIPFMDTNYFDFAYGDTLAGERIIDSQYGSNTLYVGAANQLFGVNFADGRIKGYGLQKPGGGDKTFLVLCVRGRTDYGVSDFTDNGDGTVTDSATGLMWQQVDSGSGMFWEDALSYAETLDLAGHSDWRLPNAKELQSILDYSRSPNSSSSPALDPVFDATQITNEAGAVDYPCYWTGTTHINWTANPGGAGIYVAFGRAMGYMNSNWVDVHGAGAQRSDPKEGDPADFPYGRGPQGDAIRIYNYVRCVRDAS
jgi:PKD repeat protein